MMNEKSPIIRIPDKMILLGIGLGLIFWLFESTLHAFFLNNGDFIKHLLTPSPHEIWMRLLIGGILFVFSVYCQFVITERKRVEEALCHALEASRQRQAEISALLEGSRTVLETRDFQDAARALFDSCKNLIGATAGYVAVLSKDGTQNEVLFLDSGGRPCAVDPSLPMPIRGLRAEAYRTGKAVYHNDFSKSQWAKYMPTEHVTLDNVLFAPMVIKGKVVGLLGIANKSGGFTENDARMASAFGELAAVALLDSRTLESLANSEERFRSVAQTASDAIITTDHVGNIVFWNSSAETMFGYSADEVVGQPLTLIMPERFHQAHQD
ncbi:MAG: GAF domain-containing protein, partial [bacterium]